MRHSGTLTNTAALHVFVSLLALNAYAGEVISPAVRNALAAHYPHQRISNACAGRFIGAKSSYVVALQDPVQRTFTIVWVKADGEIQQLDSISGEAAATISGQKNPGAAPFELQCMDAKQAREFIKRGANSEALDFRVRVRSGAGAVCYFTNATTADCWTLDRRTGALVGAGGWQT